MAQSAPLAVATDPPVLAQMREHPVFAQLTPTQLEHLAWASRLSSVGAGEVIYQRGQRSTHLYFVVDGRVNLALYSPGGETKVLEMLGAGAIFGEAGMFTEGGSYPVTAVGASRARIARVANRDFLAILQECPATCLRLIAHLARRLGRHIHQIEYMTLESATHRVVRALDARLPPEDEGPADVPMTETRQELASFLSMQPETLSRALRTLERSGAIQLSGRRVRVLDRGRLLSHLGRPG
jgi:CRP/FNR family transcriptional regulator, dissimilatory nitrate respiration regulator